MADHSSHHAAGMRIKCPECKHYFVICCRCYRGHQYCGKECSKRARSVSQRASEKRYKQSPLAKRLHRARQNKYNKKNLTHHTSIRSPKSLLRKPQSFALSKNEPTLERTSCRVCRRSLEWFRPLGVLLVPQKE